MMDNEEMVDAIKDSNKESDREHDERHLAMVKLKAEQHDDITRQLTVGNVLNAWILIALIVLIALVVVTLLK